MTERELRLEKGVLDSLYGDFAPLFVGFANCAVACGLCFVSSRDPNFLFIAALIVVVGLVRCIIRRAYYTRVSAASIDGATLRVWRRRCLAGGVLSCLMLGVWCFYSLYLSADQFSSFLSVTFTIGSTVGIAGRNFGSKEYVNFQTLALGVPLILGLVLSNDWLNWSLVPLYLCYLIAVVVIASSLREVLHSALQREAQVSDIADELSIALDTMPNGLFMFDEENRLKVFDSDALEMSGLIDAPETPDFFVDDLFDQLIASFRGSSETIEAFRKELFEKRRALYESDFILENERGKSLHFILKCDADNNLVVRIDDITKQRNNERRIKAMARFDALTGLSNRAWFFEQAMKRRRTISSDEAILVAVVDLDDFKSINDAYGHPTGDRMLQSVAFKLKTFIGPRDICGRFGGDEFVMVLTLPDKSQSYALDLCSNIAQAVNGTYQINGIEIEVGASIGVSVCRGQEFSIDDLIAQADFAQYAAKLAEHEQFKLFEEPMREKMLRKKRLRADLKQAVRNNQLTTMYQPIVDAKASQVVDIEALCRWTHSELGPIGPDEFIPIAEETGLISDITKQQLNAACLVCAKLPGHTGVSVNLSAVDFRSKNLLHNIRGALQLSGIDASRLTVEVTETSLLELKAETIKMVDDIRALGVKVALDDFGVGYSSLNYLHKLPLDRLKIDRSFAMNSEGSDKTRKLMATIARLAEDIDLQMVVEGVETQTQLDLIEETAKNCLYQGYLFSPPMPESAVIDYAALLSGKQKAISCNDSAQKVS